MKHINFRQIISNCLFMTEFIALFFLICAVIQGNIGFLPGMGYALASFLGVNLVTSLLLYRPAKKRSRANLRPAARTGMPFRVASGGSRTAA